MIINNCLQKIISICLQLVKRTCFLLEHDYGSTSKGVTSVWKIDIRNHKMHMVMEHW